MLTMSGYYFKIIRTVFCLFEKLSGDMKDRNTHPKSYLGADYCGVTIGIWTGLDTGSQASGGKVSEAIGTSGGPRRATQWKSIKPVGVPWSNFKRQSVKKWWWKLCFI